MEGKLRRRFGRLFGWQHRLMRFVTVWAPILVVLAIMADSVRWFPHDLPTSVRMTLEEFWMLPLAPLITGLGFGRITGGMARAYRSARARFQALNREGKAVFLDEAAAARRGRGFLCGELGVWISEFTLRRGGFYGQLLIPWPELAQAELDAKGRLWLVERGGTRHCYRSLGWMRPAAECERELRLHRLPTAGAN